MSQTPDGDTEVEDGDLKVEYEDPERRRRWRWAAAIIGAAVLLGTGGVLLLRPQKAVVDAHAQPRGEASAAAPPAAAPAVAPAESSAPAAEAPAPAPKPRTSLVKVHHKTKQRRHVKTRDGTITYHRTTETRRTVVVTRTTSP